MKEFKDLLKKKMSEGCKMSDNEKEAKMCVLDELKAMMRGKMGEDLKEVTVASDSKEGMKEGLEKAKDLVAANEEMDEDISEDDMDSDSDEKPEDMIADMSEEDMDKMMELIKKHKEEKA